MARRVPEDHAAEVEQLFRNVAAIVFRFSVSVTNGDEERAKDLVQEAFQAIALTWATARNWSVEKKTSWLCRAVINKRIDDFRKTRRLDLAVNMPDDQYSPSAESTVLSKLVIDHCMEVIKKMPPMQQKAAYLKWNREWKTKEIATELGISQSTVRVHLKNARDKLNKEVGKEIIFVDEPDDEDEYRGGGA